MKRQVLILGLIIQGYLNCNAQDTLYNKISIGVKFGVTNTKIIDEFLNSQIYHRASIKPLTISFRYFGTKNLHHIKFDRKKIKLENTVSNYDYNYIDYWNYALQYDYSHLIVAKNRIKVHGGITYKGQISNYDQIYKSKLFYYAQGVKESYDLSISTIYINSQATVKLNSTNLILVGYHYALLNYGLRPNAYITTDVEYNLYSFGDFTAYLFHLEYQGELSKRINYTFQLNMELYRYSGYFELRKKELQYLFGLAYRL